MQALTALPHPGGLAITLEKTSRSRQALAVARRMRGRCFGGARAAGLPDDWRARAAKLGADVPACVESITCIGTGTGTELEPGRKDLAGTPVLLVNPRVPLSTGPGVQGVGWG